LWYLQESNQGHKDFQSFALPTELRYHCLIAGANIIVFFSLIKTKSKKSFVNLIFNYISI
jgi:hypothetical protein